MSATDFAQTSAKPGKRFVCCASAAHVQTYAALRFSQTSLVACGLTDVWAKSGDK